MDVYRVDPGYRVSASAKSGALTRPVVERYQNTGSTCRIGRACRVNRTCRVCRAARVGCTRPGTTASAID